MRANALLFLSLKDALPLIKVSFFIYRYKNPIIQMSTYFVSQTFEIYSSILNLRMEKRESAY